MKKPNTLSPTPTVAAVTKLNIVGNVVPPAWYETITMPTGRPDFYAILILADFVYWYKARQAYDPLTQKFMGWERKFYGDKLQANYQMLAAKFNMPLATTRHAIYRLLELGVLVRELRTVVKSDGTKLSNIPYWDLDVAVLERLTYPDQYPVGELVSPGASEPLVEAEPDDFLLDDPATPIAGSGQTLSPVAVRGSSRQRLEGLAVTGETYTKITTENTTENTTERKEDPEILDQKGNGNAVFSSLPSGANNKKLIVPNDIVDSPQPAPGEYMPGLPDPRQQRRTGIVATIDSYREQWRKLGFDEKRWQAYCKLLSDTCGLTALINVADDEVELNNVRRTAITLIKLGYGNIDLLRDLIEAYRKANEWKKTTPTLSALEKHASARNQQQTDGSDANGQTGQATRIVIEYPNPVDIAMYPGVDPNTFTWHRQVITSRKEYEQLYLRAGVVHRVISGYEPNSAAK